MDREHATDDEPAAAGPTCDEPPRIARDDAMTELFRLFGRPHTVAIAHRFACDPGPWRYSELEATLDISPTTLSRRLSALDRLGIVERRSYDEIPPRVEYTATPKGEALKPVFFLLDEWVDGDVADRTDERTDAEE